MNDVTARSLLAVANAAAAAAADTSDPSLPAGAPMQARGSAPAEGTTPDLSLPEPPVPAAVAAAEPVPAAMNAARRGCITRWVAGR